MLHILQISRGWMQHIHQTINDEDTHCSRNVCLLIFQPPVAPGSPTDVYYEEKLLETSHLFLTMKHWRIFLKKKIPLLVVYTVIQGD